MGIIRNDIPILEFDSDTSAVIIPDHEGLGLKLPEKAVFAFLGEHIEGYAKANKAKKVSEFLSCTKGYPVYITSYKGEKIVLVQAPVGSSASVQVLDWLISYGVRKVISGGCCGALAHFPENTFLVPYKALRDEGTSYHYMPPSRYIEIDRSALTAIEKALTSNGFEYREVITWSTDGFFRETKEKVEYRREEGCEVVEMECSALAACARLRGVEFGELLFTADSLSDTENYDERGWGLDSFDRALELCLEAALLL